MPKIPLKSEGLRKVERALVHPFVSNDVSDFERFLILEEFENMMKTVDPKQNWNFGDRVYEERFNKTTLSRTLYKALLYGPEYAHNYYERYDSLLVSCFYNKPATRVSRKKWTCRWRTLPNLENWIKHFKENDSNLNTNTFYDIDYKVVENLHERVKLMYPDDDSVIMCNKFNVGSEASYHYKVLKENLMFGIRNSGINPKWSELWAVLENQTRLLIELEDDQTKVSKNTESEEKKQEATSQTELPERKSPEVNSSASFTVTLPNGLIVKYLPKGDIMQKILKSSGGQADKKSQEVTRKDKDHNNFEEMHRVITGKGNGFFA